MKNILLIHGWNYKKYTKFNSKITDPWYDRKNFVKELKKIFNVFIIKLPGFANEPEPKEKGWNLDNYVLFIEDYIRKNNLNIDYILGYSFGGAIATRYKYKHKNSKVKIILVSPAIIRKTNNRKAFINTPKLFKPFRECLRYLYLKYIIKNKETKYGTVFLRNSYQEIVRLDLREELGNLNSNDLLIIFGEKDTMTPPNLFLEKVSENIKKRTHIIPNGTHEIGETNTLSVIEIIKENFNLTGRKFTKR